MPGTPVRDALEVDLLADVDLADEGAAQNGTALEILWPCNVQFLLEVTSVTGTTPTLAIDIQGCETSDFTTDNVVTLGSIYAGDVADGFTAGFTTFVDARYVRAVADVGGTTVVYTATVKTVQPHYNRVRGTSPTAKALA